MTFFLKPLLPVRFLRIGNDNLGDVSRIQRVKRVTTIILITLLMACSLQGLTGCADVSTKNPPTKREDVGELRIPLTGDSQKQALVAEKNEQYLYALTYWRKAREAIDSRISSISQKVVEISEYHSRQGVAYFEKRDADEALLEFIEALTYNPANKVALEYLRNRYEIGRYISYTVEKDDTFAVIAEKTYGSPSYAFMVAEFSNAGKEKNLTEGKVIRLADKDSFFSQALINYNKNLGNARRLFKTERYTEALSAARAILGNHPDDNEASYIINMSLLKIASMQQERQDYDEAIATLSQVDPSFKNVKKEIADVRELLKDSLLDAGIKKNTDLLQRGEKLCSEGRYLDAREVLKEVDPQFEDRDKVLAQVEKQLKIQAENHYKMGVSLFVEEKLAAAIQEWEKTLELDPDHPHAAQSIDKARKLLEKVQEIK
jgi:tetratricopeptide (TPR) repeat protein